jgi:two-component system sensor histidine kinase RstB
MTRLFLRYYLAVLAVLLLAWYLHGQISSRQFPTEFARLVEEAHTGTARLVTRRLNSVSAESRDATLHELQQEFDFPVVVLPVSELPRHVSTRFQRGDDAVFYFSPAWGSCIAAPLQDADLAVSLGALPEYTHIEASLRGGIHLAVTSLAEAGETQRAAVLDDLQSQFSFAVEIVPPTSLPVREQWRINRGDDAVFFERDDKNYIVSPLSYSNDVALFGPLPDLNDIERRVLATTLAIVLLVAALAIAILLRPVARQLRLVEGAAKAIAAGELTARVDESRVHSARPLAQAFNNMADRTEQLLKTQRELLQAVSHELRTPLSRIRFATDLIESADNPQDLRKRLDAVDAATEELDQLIGELLSYVRLETITSELPDEHVQLSDLLQELTSQYAALFPTVEFAIDQQTDDPDACMTGDAVGIRRALGNVLANAGRYAKGHVRITVSQQGDQFLIDVDDDGPGIPEPERNRVLEPFVRLTSEDGAEQGGVGLGLALVNRIVSQHGGTVSVLSAPDGGCRIRTAWPVNSTQA